MFVQRALIISSFIISTSVGAFAQTSPSPSPGPAAPNAAPAPAAPKPPTETAAPATKASVPFGGHLPIIDLAPEATFADPGSTKGAFGNAALGLPGVVTGKFNLSGSVTIPVAKGLSVSYDRVAGNFINSTFGRITNAKGEYVEPGSKKRREEVFRLDYGLGKTGLGLEFGSEFNKFECCFPFEYHDAYAALAYNTPAIAALHGTHFVLIEKALTAQHHAPEFFGLPPNSLDIGKREYGLDTVVVAIVPIVPHFYVTGTYFNGAYDFFEHAPYPFRFNLFNETANFVINPNATVVLGFTNNTQQNQAAPFGDHNAIHFVSYYSQLKLHFDLNKVFAPK